MSTPADAGQPMVLPVTGSASPAHVAFAVAGSVADCDELLVDSTPEWPVPGNAAVPALRRPLHHLWVDAGHQPSARFVLSAGRVHRTDRDRRQRKLLAGLADRS